MKITDNLYPASTQAGAKPLIGDIGKSFSSLMNEVSENLNNADEIISQQTTGKALEDIPGAMIALEKSDISVKLLLAVRNKVLSAYQEISRMQI